MKRRRLLATLLVVTALVLGLTLPAAAEEEPPEPGIEPELVEADLGPGKSMTIEKKVTTQAIPPVVDIALLEDETGSFGDDIYYLQGGTTASDIYDTIVATSPDANFAVAGFRDYPQSPYGAPGDWVYRLLSSMSPDKTDWLAGIALLSAGGGLDMPEAQYDAIVAAAGPGVNDCGWRDPAATPGVQRVLVVTTDAPFHLPGAGKPHVNDQASTVAALNAQNIIVVGLKAPGSGGELDALAAATGGSVQPLSSNGQNIAEAILAGLEELTTDVWWEVTYCDPGLSVTLTPYVHYNVPGSTTVRFAETITVDEGVQPCTLLKAKVEFYANSYPDKTSAQVWVQTILVHVIDDVPPEVSCVPGENPHGKNVPGGKAKGKGMGDNPDGFYELIATDIGYPGDPGPQIFVGTVCGTIVGGPYQSGDIVKITEAPGATPSVKKIGSTNGQAGAVIDHIILPSDAVVWAVDASGNTSQCTTCLVPPPPK